MIRMAKGEGLEPDQGSESRAYLLDWGGNVRKGRGAAAGMSAPLHASSFEPGNAH